MTSPHKATVEGLHSALSAVIEVCQDTRYDHATRMAVLDAVNAAAWAQAHGTEPVKAAGLTIVPVSAEWHEVSA
ncbi:hypothetical protein CFN78_06885 [Amycolatopsis antarctica]|uniref:Uncharacterized protein n=1 Tax=Amycolatopsis antarctica TaxID=1854586 RepID=A0A263D959_9PSEU|nr:hypothetical protein [Amycolatopsis antarctica]OZM74006.1 hypothetical protein CFN78_06885 [Amycolatopsis antarctica]